MDRLLHVQAYAAKNTNASTPPPLTSHTWMEVTRCNPQLRTPQETSLKSTASFQMFIRCTDHVQQTIAAIYATLEELQRVQADYFVSLESTPSKGVFSRVQALSQRINQLATEAKMGLDLMLRSTARLKETQDSIAANSAIIRTEENQYTHLVLKLTTAMAEYQRHQSANEAFYKAQTQRQIKIKYTNPDGSAIDDATAAQLAEQVLENNTTSYIFQQSKDVLASITETRKDMAQVEQSMRKLNQLFSDLAFLVHEQDETLDLILVNFQRSTGKVEKGRMELKHARKYKRSIRNKIVGSIAVVGAVVGGAAAAVFIP